MKKVFAVTVGIMLLCMVGGSASAGWTVVDLHPAGAKGVKASEAHGVSGGQQVGYATIGGKRHAGLWSGTAKSWVDLHPAGATWSKAFGVSGGQQVGYATIGGIDHAGMWSGTAKSWVDLHPSGAAGSSWAFGVSGGQQVGYAGVGGSYDSEAEEWSGGKCHASLWSGTADSWVDLNPAGAAGSFARGVSGGKQVGDAEVGGKRHAGLWSGTAASWVDLNPKGATESSAYGVSGGKQVGYATVGGKTHAGLWSGTAASWVDLNPSGATTSCAGGICGDRQVGHAEDAGLWSGTAESWVDLHALLPAGKYKWSNANGIDVSAGEIWVAGYACTKSKDEIEAVLWHYVPEPSPK